MKALALTLAVALSWPNVALAAEGQPSGDEEAGSDEVAAVPDEAEPPADVETEPTPELDAEGEPAADESPDVEPEPEPDAPPSSELETASESPAEDYGPDQGFAPGGYYRRGQLHGREPPDGYRNVVLGSILVPLGAIATVSSAVGIYLTVPAHCTERLPAIGLNIEDPERCKSVFAFNVVRTSYGALMLITGGVILGIGLVQRQKYKSWREKHGLRAWVVPAGRGGAAGLRLRF